MAVDSIILKAEKFFIDRSVSSAINLALPPSLPMHLENVKCN